MSRSYRPRLSAVSRLRESQRDEKRQHVADALRAEAILNEQQQQLLHEIESVINDRREATKSKKIDPNHLIESQRYETNLRAQQKQLTENITAVEVETTRRQQALVQAEREVRTIELLEERGLQQHQLEEQRLEQRNMDEIASRTASNQKPFANKSPL